MYIIVFGVVILKLQISVSDPQFPRHIDLQKVGEAIFNNEKFNILKPTAHLVTDHFKDFMLRQKSAHPGDRVFIDKNGFRHSWSGFGDKTKSLRKTDLKHIIFENVSEHTPDSGIISTDGNDNDNATATLEDSNGHENNNQEEENNASRNNETVQNLNEEDPETPDSEETTTTINIPLDGHEINSTEITIEQRLASNINETDNKVGGRKGEAKAKSEKPAKDKGKKDEKDKGKKNEKDKGKKDEKDKGKKDVKDKGKKDEKDKGKTNEKDKDKKDEKDKGKKDEKDKGIKDGKDKGKKDEKDKSKKDEKGKKDEKAKDKITAKPNDNKPIAKERTVATTTFFCPFFGVITMSAFID